MLRRLYLKSKLSIKAFTSSNLTVSEYLRWLPAKHILVYLSISLLEIALITWHVIETGDHGMSIIMWSLFWVTLTSLYVLMLIKRIRKG